MAAEDLKAALQHLHTEGNWGELQLHDGLVRTVKVDSLFGDTVAVRQVVGAFQGKQIEEYFHRAERAGLPERRERSPLLALQQRMLAELAN